MEKITVSDYLVQELSKLGIEEFFGLPGDYNFNILNSIENNKNTKWVGCTNELNSGYAADGYARIKGYGAIVTTFGVGELSAINAIAGSFAEGVPVIKIVGAPATKFIVNNVLKHHNFMEPDYFAFESAYSNVVQATVFLGKENPKDEIDRILETFVKSKKPVYIAIPEDVCLIEIDNISKIKEPQSNEINLQESVEFAYGLIKRANNPVVLADILVQRNFATESFKKFLKKSGINSASMIMSNGMIEWSDRSFMGTYLGRFENKDIYKKVNESDCVICCGVILSDFNTLGFDFNFDPKANIQVFGNHVIIQNQRYEEVYMPDFFEVLSEKLTSRGISVIKNRPKFDFTDKSEISGEKITDFNYILPRFQSFLKPNDMIFVETGILEFFGAVLTMPEGAQVYNQCLWGSIGWATPAFFGAACAAKHHKFKNRRAVLFTGEGAHQLTFQALSDFVRNGLKPIIIVLNNSGYTIERILSKDPDNAYNDIPCWNYTEFPKVFGGDVWCKKARTDKEFDEALKEAEKENEKRMCYIEVFTDKTDIPFLMKDYINFRQNKK